MVGLSKGSISTPGLHIAKIAQKSIGYSLAPLTKYFAYHANMHIYNMQTAGSCWKVEHLYVDMLQAPSSPP